jgi:hypothetical protein
MPNHEKTGQHKKAAEHHERAKHMKEIAKLSSGKAREIGHHVVQAHFIASALSAPCALE